MLQQAHTITGWDGGAEGLEGTKFSCWGHAAAGAVTAYAQRSQIVKGGLINHHLGCS